MLPVPFFVLYIAAVLELNSLICLHFNKSIPENGLKSTEDQYSQQWGPHDDEYWIFLNGICVGRNWLQNNIDRLSRTFHRPVVGVHNKTTGVIFDIIQCLIQRALLYATSDIRDCYVLVKRALYKPGIKKVVLILHSQGGIEGGMILDWLLDEVPQNLLQYLEVYTFGCLANHFSNPCRNLSTTDPVPSQETLAEGKKRPRAISHIEHYANAFDFATRWGVLHFTQAEMDGSFENRFMGRVFVNPVPGHQLNQHYLGNFFPLDPTRRFTREPRAGDFMNMDAQVDESRGNGPEGEEVLLSLAASRLLDGRDGALNNGTYGNNELRKLKMWECSRLWQYRNGATPVPVS
uniref:DUF676 domain-containing protein n=3 Tax=Bionectria ochroleuca TaxID=29856 RepID=A0A8H7NHF0_BIOOC